MRTNTRYESDSAHTARLARIAWAWHGNEDQAPACDRLAITEWRAYLTTCPSETEEEER